MSIKTNPTRRLLMGPGPSSVSERVLTALSRPTLGHLDPEFVAIMDDCKRLLQYAFMTENELTIPVSAPGSAGMETCFMNLVESGDDILVCVNGVFGTRMVDVAERIGARVHRLDCEWGMPVEPDDVRQVLEQHAEITLVAFVHAETSTGARSDAESICAVAHEFDCLTLVDAVTSLGGIELRVDDWGIDAVYSGSQKCLSCVPGISPVSFSDAAVARIRNRRSKCLSWFLDLNLVMDYWGTGKKRAYHHTAPVNNIYALHESLLILSEEGLENAWARHRRCHDYLTRGLDDMGLNFIVEPDYRLPQLNAVMVPGDVDEAGIRQTLLQKYDLEIGAGLGKFAGHAWRIGLMGHSCREENVDYCLNSLTAAIDSDRENVASQA